MIKHIVLIKWKIKPDEKQLEAIESGFALLAGSLDYIQHYDYGQALNLFPSDYDYGLVAGFATEDDFRRYVKNEQHQALIKELIQPYMLQHTSLQFLCPAE